MKSPQVMLEVKGQNRPAVFGRVGALRSGEGYGFLQVDGCSDPVEFNFAGARFVEAGISHPRLGSQLKSPLKVGDRVVLTRPTFGKHRTLFAFSLCLASFFERAEEKIAKRPVFRVVHSDTRFQGQMMPKEARTSVYAVGTMEELQHKYPRGKKNDPLASGYRTGPVTVPCVFWERLINPQLNIWERTNDPRPMPRHLTRIVCVEVKDGATGEPRELWRGKVGDLLGMTDFLPEHGHHFMFLKDDMTLVEGEDPRLAEKTGKNGAPQGGSGKVEVTKRPSPKGPPFQVSPHPEQQMAA